MRVRPSIWAEFGTWGRSALLALGLAVVAVAGMGVAIERAARDDLLAARTELLSRVVSRLDIPDATSSTDEWTTFDSAVRQRLLGGETVRVKLWDDEGTIIYSDLPELVGRRFEPHGHSIAAFAGETVVDISDGNRPENTNERNLGPLIEFYLPVVEDGRTVAVFETYQTTDSLDSSMARIRRDVWTAVFVGVALLVLAIVGLTVAGVRAVDRRRRQAEDMSEQLMVGAEQERRRIVAALHDDIGQPLYRILYGLQGSRARTADPVVAAELSRLEGLVRDVDDALRGELRILNRAAVAEVGLRAAIEDLVDATQIETDLGVTARISALPELPPGSAAALFRALQEALFNVRKHAGRGVNVRISATAGRRIAEIRVEDDGVGWTGEEGLGLSTVRRDLEAIGGGLTIARGRSAGTTVVAWVPIKGQEEAA